MINKKTTKELQEKLEGKIGLEEGCVTPSLQVQAFKHGKKVVDINMGESFKYYDLASLTKVIFTTTLFMHIYEKNERILENKILSHLPWFFHPALSVRQLLTHTTGLVPHKPYYIQMDMSRTRAERWETLRELLSQEKPDLIIKSSYSDLNYMLLGFLLEQVLEKPLAELWTDFSEILGLKKTHFHIDNKPVYKEKDYAPTEVCPWREARLQGQVHDENAWGLGGVSTHAGLFGPIEDVAQWFLFLRSIYTGEKKNPFISQNTIQAFWQRAISKESGDWALGFMLPNEQSSTAGARFSKSSVGHTGFTGTSFWYDPEADTAVIILSNRVYFGRNNAAEFNKIRSLVHDVCYKNING